MSVSQKKKKNSFKRPTPLFIFRRSVGETLIVIPILVFKYFCDRVQNEKCYTYIFPSPVDAHNGIYDVDFFKSYIVRGPSQSIIIYNSL